jgi:hypothetical protein
MTRNLLFSLMLWLLEVILVASLIAGRANYSALKTR